MEKPELPDALEHLRHMESFQVVHEYIAGIYEDAIRELASVSADKLQMKAGEITAYKEILDLIEKS